MFFFNLLKKTKTLLVEKRTLLLLCFVSIIFNLIFLSQKYQEQMAKAIERINSNINIQKPIPYVVYMTWEYKPLSVKVQQILIN